MLPSSFLFLSFTFSYLLLVTLFLSFFPPPTLFSVTSRRVASLIYFFGTFLVPEKWCFECVLSDVMESLLNSCFPPSPR